MSVNKRNLLPVFTFKQWQETSEMNHCFTTKHGGVSTEEWASLNLGFNRGDTRENVLENYERVAQYLHTSTDQMVLSRQVHETKIYQVFQADAGNGIKKDNKWESCDGIYTREHGLTLVTHYADCVPLVFYSKAQGGIIGMTHAGWRGTVAEIGAKMVKQWVEEEHIPIESIQVGIGPSIGPCCFEVHEDVAIPFKEAFGEDVAWIKPLKENKFSIDLWQCNYESLVKVGILPEQIECANVCTSCEHDTYYSHRKTQGKRGTLGAFMQLK